MKWVDDFNKFLIETFTFIPKNKIETILVTNLSNTEYFLVCIGIWLVLIVLIWFVVWMTFKICRYWK